MALTEQAANRLGEIFITYLKKKIRERIYPYGNPDVKGTSNKYASGELYNSISYKLKKVGEDQYLIEFISPEYFDYVNKGRKPKVKRVPLNVLLEWISIRRIQPKGYSGRGRYSVKGKTSLGYAIQQNIFKYGIRPANLIDKTYDSLEEFFQNPPPQLEEQLGEVFELIQQDINNLIENILTERPKKEK